MVYTYIGCSRSNFTVSPKNWRTQKASVKKPWKIFYRFYDPACRDAYPGGKDIPIRKMNKYKTLLERQEATRELLEIEKELIDVDGYNPITRKFMRSVETITKKTALVEALNATLPLLQLEGHMEGHTIEDIRSVLKYFSESARMLRKDIKSIGDVTRGEIIAILNNCGNLWVTLPKGEKRKKVWNPNQFNTYRKYLHILYSKIELDEVLPYNPIEKIPIKQAVIIDLEDTQRQILSDAEAQLVNETLIVKDPGFHTFIHVFSSSGARRTETMLVKGKQVRLDKKKFQVIVKKGKGGKKAVWKTITKAALPYWEKAMKGCDPEDYVFSKGLRPGPVPIRPEQVTRRWERHVKSLGILSDLYDLKHRNTTKTVDAIMDFFQRLEIAQKVAAEKNSHTSPRMTKTVYDVKNDARIHELLSEVDTSFT